MGFFDALFGGGKTPDQPKTPTKQSEKSEPIKQQTDPLQTIAVLAAAVSSLTVKRSFGMLRIRKQSKNWSLIGRSESMNCRKL